jgi:hypothetical protein
LIRLVDALLVCDFQKTLTNLYRQLADKCDPKTAAEFFRECPWQVVDVSGPRKRWMLFKFCGWQRWQVICAVKSNRRFNRKRMTYHNQSLRNKRYQRHPADKYPKYLV